ncbi:hypothetical protein [uncultured Microscilla sp.]|uniref:hypothetical protein n=1 Tax=uncultured Microscilla sp. TaxID=432653 RepID=UPI00260A2168|nr:hypothetical protein [uncultured Microscilla sp.]
MVCQHTGWGQSHYRIMRYFDKAYQQSLDYLWQHRATLKKHLPSDSAEAAFVLAMGFPELLRFEAMQNKMETLFLELLYVKNGAAYANFSVGRFQMKPSFAETLEKYAKTYIPKATPQVYLYQASSIKDVRRERVKRLNQLSWQLRYLYTLYQVLNYRYSQQKFPSNAHKLRFFAAAYNYGFLSKSKKIQQWTEVKAFPHGRNHIGKQHNYSIIALDFFKYEALKLTKQ